MDLLRSDDGFLKLQPTERRPFQEVFNGLTSHGRCYIVHGVWHSGKTTLLNSLDERLRVVGSAGRFARVLGER